MKNTLFLSCLFSLTLTATETTANVDSLLPEQCWIREYILPLPDFHESWTQEEKDVLNNFARTVEQQFRSRFRSSVLPSPATKLPAYTRFRDNLHQGVKNGYFAPKFSDGDSFCRWAAEEGDFEALKLFVQKGADSNVSFCEHAYQYSLIHSLLIGNLNQAPSHSSAEQLDMIHWLVDHGYKLELYPTELTYAVIALCLYRSEDIAPIVEWYFSINPEVPEELRNELYHAVLLAQGCTTVLKQLVEEGKIALNEPMAVNDLLPLQTLFTQSVPTIHLPTLEYLLSAGADPNLHIGYEEDANESDEYSPEGYEEEDKPNEALTGFSTPIELAFDLYLIYGSHEAIAHPLLAAIDLLLYYGAELEIEEDSAGDEDEDSPIYAEIRKRLQMDKEELMQDYLKLKS